MTRTAERLGASLDREPEQRLHLEYLQGMPDRDVMPFVEDQAREAGDEELATQLGWERGIMDLRLLGLPHGELFRGASLEDYAKFYRMTPATREYTLARADETGNPVLRAHHLAYARATIPQTGREWVALTRRLAATLREHTELVLRRLTPGADGIEACPLIEALPVLVHLMSMPGIYSRTELEDCVTWLVAVAERLREHEWSASDYNQPHRWPFEVVRHVTAFRATYVGERDRERALRLVGEAFEFFRKEPLASDFTAGVASIDHELRRHFGERDTHRTMTRRVAEALKQQGDFFREHGFSLGAASMYRDTMKVAQEHGQHFSAEERADLARQEQDAITDAVGGGEFKLAGTVRLNMSDFDFTGRTPDETIANLRSGALDWLPDIGEIRSLTEGAAVEHPLLEAIPHTAIDGDRVVAEAISTEEHQAAAVAGRVAMHGEALGVLVSGTLTNASASQGLTAEHLLAALRPLPLTQGTIPVLERGLERFLARDYVSAMYILAPLVEEAIRRLLRAAGFDTTTFRAINQATGASRTDDATLGDLLRLEHADGRTAGDVLDAGLHHLVRATLATQGGPNLRNKVGHGQAAVGDCSPAHAGLLVFVMVCLARRAEEELAPGSSVRPRKTDADRGETRPRDGEETTASQ